LVEYGFEVALPKPASVLSRDEFIPPQRWRMAASRCEKTARQTATFSQTRRGTDAANFATDDAIRRSELNSWNRETIIGLSELWGKLARVVRPARL
jgi:hypothetical protein